MRARARLSTGARRPSWSPGLTAALRERNRDANRGPRPPKPPPSARGANPHRCRGRMCTPRARAGPSSAGGHVEPPVDLEEAYDTLMAYLEDYLSSYDGDSNLPPFARCALERCGLSAEQLAALARSGDLAPAGPHQYRIIPRRRPSHSPAGQQAGAVGAAAAAPPTRRHVAPRPAPRPAPGPAARVLNLCSLSCDKGAGVPRAGDSILSFYFPHTFEIKEQKWMREGWRSGIRFFRSRRRKTCS